MPAGLDIGDHRDGDERAILDLFQLCSAGRGRWKPRADAVALGPTAGERVVRLGLERRRTCGPLRRQLRAFRCQRRDKADRALRDHNHTPDIPGSGALFRLAERTDAAAAQNGGIMVWRLPNDNDSQRGLVRKAFDGGHFARSRRRDCLSRAATRGPGAKERG